MALALYQEEVQEKINSSKNVEKFLVMFGTFGNWIFSDKFMERI